MYLSIFLAFARKIIDKVSLLFDECVPIVNEDDEDWFAIRLFHKFFIYSNISKQAARNLAMQMYKEIPELRGHIEVVQHEDPIETPVSDIKGLSKDAVDNIYDIFSAFEEE
jgi:hypothetical protein